MQTKHEYLATAPFDLYELYLFNLVVRHRSFTRAAEVAGLTQSAMTRQMQGLENSLGLDLLERTTRSVRITPAGEYLYRESARLIGDVETTLQRLKEEFAGARKQVRVGVSQTVGLAYLPGFFHANLRKQPEVICRVTYDFSRAILSAIQTNDLELGVLCPPPRLPTGLKVTHRFDDDFVLIVPSSQPLPDNSSRAASLNSWMQAQNWLLISDSSNTGQQLRRWLASHRWKISPTMELNSFDLIINLVSLGMGASFVPVRSLALYGQKRTIRRVPLRHRFTRQLVVVGRIRGSTPNHLTRFIENILF